MRHLVASLICIALLVLMVAIFGLVQAGAYEDFAVGRPFDPANLEEIFSPLIYRKVLIAFIVAMGFAVLDIQSLVSRTEEDASSEFTPKSQPLGYAALRARRYALPVLVLLYLGLSCRLGVTPEKAENFTATFDSYIFVGLFLLARRPLDMTVSDAWKVVVKCITDFLDAFAKGGR